MNNLSFFVWVVDAMYNTYISLFEQKSSIITKKLHKNLPLRIRVSFLLRTLIIFSVVFFSSDIDPQ